MHEVFANLADGGRLHQRRRARSWCPVCERPTQEPEALCVEHAALWMAGAAADGARDVLAILGPHKDLADAAGDAIRAAIAVLEDDRRAASALAATFAEVLRA